MAGGRYELALADGTVIGTETHSVSPLSDDGVFRLRTAVALGDEVVEAEHVVRVGSDGVTWLEGRHRGVDLGAEVRPGVLPSYALVQLPALLSVDRVDFLLFDEGELTTEAACLRRTGPEEWVQETAAGTVYVRYRVAGGVVESLDYGGAVARRLGEEEAAVDSV